MNPEEQLDRLIDQHQRGGWPQAATPEERGALGAAEALLSLRSVAPSPAFSVNLELQLRARARTLAAGGPLRRVAARPLPMRRWAVVAAAAVLVALASLGVLRAAAMSLPGDPLYGIKAWQNAVRLDQAGSPADRAQVQLQELQAAIADLRTEQQARRSDDDLRAALAVVAQMTAAARTAVAQVSASAAHDADAADLAATFQQEDTTLRQGLAVADWPVRVAFTGQLGALGDAVPAISAATFAPGADSVTVTLTGANFAAGARLVVNGAPLGTVQRVTPTTLTAQVAELPEGAVRVGVLNPDGTAAETTTNPSFTPGDNGHGPPGATETPGDNGKGIPHGTPAPGDSRDATPTPGDGHGTPTPTTGG